MARRTSGGDGVRWPGGARFAFTIVDDTDAATVGNVRPVYELLAELGFRTTKTVWPLAPRSSPTRTGETLEDDGYRAWILDLERRGFEIALHGAADEPSERDRVRSGLDRYRDVLGADPRIHANHTGQIEGMYWGEARLDQPVRTLYRLANRLARQGRPYFGHVEGSPYFWGDLCRERIDYVRNLTFPDVDTLACDPLMPYHDPRRPHVNSWFSASNGHDLDAFLSLVSERNQDRLMARGGACIAYTHFGFGFVRDGVLDPRFAALMRRLAGLPGWFVPASTLLDHLRSRPGWRPVARRPALLGMQLRFLASRLRTGTT